VGYEVGADWLGIMLKEELNNRKLEVRGEIK